MWNMQHLRGKPDRRQDPQLRLVSDAQVREPVDVCHEEAAELVERMKWALALPYERMAPEMQAFWRDVAVALRSALRHPSGQQEQHRGER